ncbi:amidase signature enzyme [Artomyces pyxidatus]|uniref:Amidase signature enzyme n=1 Tax=Artomyces pyxidatus TaxID=48021 RepID=A0ACB8T281_9AGAM|nr:amidase signature enzyme [Artomyces pyxidatus]
MHTTNQVTPPTLPDLYEASIAELQNGLEKGIFSSVHLVKAYLLRIEEVNLQGPTLRAVIETNPHALEQAAVLDREREATGSRGPLHGIPILLKDNIATQASDGMNTTAGSLALLGSIPPRDATVAAKLRAAGAILLGKTNLCEWSHSRGDIAAGFSARGGQATSPYVPLGDPSGSSSGSATGTAIGLAAAALGTETHGSIILPSGSNNVVGLKPTVGLTSRAGVIPISMNQDSVGAIARSVTDAAIILSFIAGRDSLDEFTLAQPENVPDFTKALKPDGLKGVRLGVPRLFQSEDPNITAAFDAALDIIRGLGATVVDPAEFSGAEELLNNPNEKIVMTTEFKVGVKNYISGLLEVPTGVKDLADLIVFNNEHASEELPPPYYMSQSKFIEAEKTTMDAAYYAALATNKDLGRTRGIDGALKKFNLDALLLPTDEHTPGPAAIAGYPVITVPLGFHPDSIEATPATPVVEKAPGYPFGISFIGTAWSDFSLTSYAYAYEQATHTRLNRLAYPEAIPKTQLSDILPG